MSKIICGDGSEYISNNYTIKYDDGYELLFIDGEPVYAGKPGSIEIKDE